jgi:hypothetical protein
MIAVEKKKVVDACRHTDKEEGVTDQSRRACIPSETEGKESLHDVIGVFFFKGGFIEYKVIQMKGDPKRKGKCIVKRIGERIDHIADGKKGESGIVDGIKVEKEMRDGTIGKDSIEETECSKESNGCNDRGPHALFRGGGSSQFFRGTKGTLFGSAKGSFLFGGAEGAAATFLRIQIGRHCFSAYFSLICTWFIYFFILKTHIISRFLTKYLTFFI